MIKSTNKKQKKNIDNNNVKVNNKEKGYTNNENKNINHDGNKEDKSNKK